MDPEKKTRIRNKILGGLFLSEMKTTGRKNSPGRSSIIP